VLRRRLTITGSTLRHGRWRSRQAIAQACASMSGRCWKAARIKPVIHSTFAAADAAQAHALMESNQHIGKIV
jgi:NADPH2:quinone reductase